MSEPKRRGFINILQEFSIPLLSGVAVAMLWANLDHDSYERVVEWVPLAGLEVFGHAVTLHWLVNDVFMVFFFGIAAKEITESCLPGGNLNPIKKSVNPLLATLGGVMGPVCVFFIGMSLLYGPTDDLATLRRGWGIPTATDIALAWLVARAVFGKGHPAIDFLLLLAVVDDGIGLAIIAIFYGDPHLPARPEFLPLIALGMAIAYAMRRARVKSWIPYIAIGGPIAWLGLSLAHLHPALALVFIVPFLPAPRRDVGLFIDEDEVDVMGPELARDLHITHSPLHQFEHQMKRFVDFGLFFFAFTNAGVVLASIGTMTWLILGSLVIGKTVGITLFGLLASLLGFPLPDRMGVRELIMAGFVASLGLTVALFVAGAAFTHPELLGEAKMGSLFSGFVGIAAVLIGRALGMSRPRKPAPQ
ncbi:MAG TPA: Na+/H+ antiporter NhaA [Myxococcota bacterium]|nr:Na+/H+ antiporter NhaA [Myxococcota bacterium]